MAKEEKVTTVKLLVRKVWLDKNKNQMHITIPNDNGFGIQAGDYVIIERLEDHFKKLK